jgi:hypothetical protein
LIEDGLWHVVADRPKAAKAKRVLPRVSTATGGPMPGISGLSFSELQELDDLEYMDRLRKGFK